MTAVKSQLHVYKHVEWKSQSKKATFKLLSFNAHTDSIYAKATTNQH